MKNKGLIIKIFVLSYLLVMANIIFFGTTLPWLFSAHSTETVMIGFGAIPLALILDFLSLIHIIKKVKEVMN